jgi:inorganic pyrophosphatase
MKHGRTWTSLQIRSRALQALESHASAFTPEVTMDDLTQLSNQFDEKKGTCRAIIETPKGCRNKFDYDPDSNLFMLGGLLPEGMMFPFDFGFIPSTLAEDGDPVDIMVLMDAPAHVGCLIEVRIIGVIEAEQIEDGKTETNDRLLGVAIHSYDHEDLESIDDVSKTLLDQVEAFFVSYNKQRGKKFKITSTSGRKKAMKHLESGMKTFESQVARKSGKKKGAR